MADSDSKFHNGHRERLRQKFLDGKLAEYEKLELMLSYVVPRRDMRPLAHALLKKFGSLSSLLTADIDDLLAFPGVGRNTVIFMKLFHQIIVEGYRSTMCAAPIFHNENVLKNYCKWILGNRSVEEFHVLYLDAEYRLLQDETHSVGTIDTSGVYIREIVKHALQLNSTGIVLIHNHPVTDNGFSREDVETTEKLQALCKELGIKLYNHFLVSKYAIYAGTDYGFVHS